MSSSHVSTVLLTHSDVTSLTSMKVPTQLSLRGFTLFILIDIIHVVCITVQVHGTLTISRPWQ